MDDSALREQLVSSLEGRGAHMGFERAVKGMTPELAGRRVPGLAHTAWQLAWHIGVAQHDILEFVRDPGWKSPSWPEGYWPREDAPKSATAWEEMLARYRRDQVAIITLVRDAKSDLFAPFPHGDGQTLLREALLVIDHTSYHTGQVVDLRRLLGIG